MVMLVKIAICFVELFISSLSASIFDVLRSTFEVHCIHPSKLCGVKKLSRDPHLTKRWKEIKKIEYPTDEWVIWYENGQYDDFEFMHHLGTLHMHMERALYVLWKLSIW